MPIAQLHDGTQIHFPEGTPDEHIDGAVQRHLGIQPPAPPSATGAMLPALLAAVQEHLSGQQNQHDGQQQDALGVHKMIAASRMQQADEHAQMSAGAVQGMAQALSDALAPLGVVAQNSGALPDVVQAINQLSNTIAQAMKAYISIASAPKELYHHADGKPKGVRPVQYGINEQPF